MSISGQVRSGYRRQNITAKCSNGRSRRAGASVEGGKVQLEDDPIMSDEKTRNVAAWEQRVRLFGLIVTAAPPTVVGCLFLFTFLGEVAGVGVLQRIAIWSTFAVEVLAIVISRREPPRGWLLGAVRAMFFTTCAAVAVTAALKVGDEDVEILSAPFYLVMIILLHGLYKRCVTRFEEFRK
jgi:hypothetical protein